MGPRSEIYADRVASPGEQATMKLRKQIEKELEEQNKRFDKIVEYVATSRPNWLSWLDDALPREKINALISCGLLKPNGDKPDFFLPSADVGRIFDEAGYHKWAEIVDHILIYGRMPKSKESLRRRAGERPIKP